MANSVTWATPFNGNSTYDFQKFDIKNTPFYGNCKNYYTISPTPTVYYNPPSPPSNKSGVFMNVSPLKIKDPTIRDINNVPPLGIHNEQSLINGFTSSYLLGYNAGITSDAKYVYITEEAFDLINKTDGTQTTASGKQIVIIDLIGVYDLYKNNKMQYTNTAGYNDIDFQRGFFGVYNGYYQGYLDGVHMKTAGNPNVQTYSSILDIKNQICNLAQQICSKDSSSVQCSSATQMCNAINKRISSISPISLPPSSQLQQILNDLQNNLKTIQNGSITDTQDYRTLYLQTLSKLYKAVKSQNDTTLKEISTNINTFSADDQKVYYQLQQIETLSYINIILLVVYYLLFLVSIYFIIAVDTKMSRNWKWITIVFFAIYPFIINPLFLYLYNASLYIYALLNVNIYSTPDY